MKHPLLKSRTFRIWIACYLIVLLIPLAFSGLLQADTSRRLQTRAMEDGSHSLKLLSGITDERLTGVINQANTICTASDIIKLRFITLPFDAAKYYEVHQRAGFLTNFTAQSELVSGCYVYCDNLETILDAHHIYTRDNQYGRIVSQVFGMDEEAFLTLVHTRHTLDFRLVGDGEKLLLVKSVSSGIRNNRPALTLIMVLDTAALQDPFRMAGANWQGQAMLLLPEEALPEEKQSTNEEAESRIPADGDSARGNARRWISTESRMAPGPESVTVTQKSEAAEGVGYALIIPRNRLMEDADSNRKLFVVFSAAVLLLGSTTAFLLARRNYQPVRELSREIEAKEEESGAFSAISKRVGEMRAEMARLSMIEDQQIFEALLSGKSSGMDREQIRLTDGQFEGDLFVTALLEPEREEANPPDEKAFLQDLKDQLNKEEGNPCRAIVRPYGEGYAAVLGFAGDVSRYDAQLYAQKLMKTVLSRDKAFPALSGYLGNAHEGLEGIGRSCEEAAKAREYANFVSRTGRQVVLFDETMVSSGISWQNYDIVDAERRFVSLMLEGDYGSSEQLLHEILSYYTGQEGLSLRVMQTRMYGVINMMVNVLHEVEPEIGTGEESLEDPLELLLRTRTMQELEDVVGRIMRQLRLRHEETQDQLSSRLEDVTRFIHANYADENLSVQMLADRFGLSLPYLSREFKNSRGIGVLNYINGYRIEKAKEILARDENITLSETARQVGYSSSQTLIRIFKRYEGVTPGQFRDEAGKPAR